MKRIVNTMPSIKNKEDGTELIRNASAGDEESFKELRQRYKSSIRGYIASRCFPGLASNIREAKESDIDQNIKEIEQNTWIQVWQKITSYEPLKGSFYRFVCIWADYMIRRYFSRKERKELPVSVLNDSLKDDSRDEISASKLLDDIFFLNQEYFQDEYLEKCVDFLKITFSQGGTPHQLEAFGFNKLISGWGPKEIVAKLSTSSLGDLYQRLVLNYKAESCLPDYIIDSCFSPLAQKLEVEVGGILEDECSRRVYGDLLEIKAGETFLKDYFGNDPEHNISDWSDKVRKKVLRILK